MTAPQTPPAGIAMANQVRRADRALHTDSDSDPITVEGDVVQPSRHGQHLRFDGPTPIYDQVRAEFAYRARFPGVCGRTTKGGEPCKLPAPCPFHARRGA